MQELNKLKRKNTTQVKLKFKTKHKSHKCNLKTPLKHEYKLKACSFTTHMALQPISRSRTTFCWDFHYLTQINPQTEQVVKGNNF